jgi:hypothetical protein
MERSNDIDVVCALQVARCEPSSTPRVPVRRDEAGYEDVRAVYEVKGVRVVVVAA